MNNLSADCTVTITEIVDLRLILRWLFLAYIYLLRIWRHWRHSELSCSLLLLLNQKKRCRLETSSASFTFITTPCSFAATLFIITYVISRKYAPRETRRARSISSIIKRGSLSH